MSKTLALGKLLQRCTLFPLLAARVLRVAPLAARVFVHWELGSAAAGVVAWFEFGSVASGRLTLLV